MSCGDSENAMSTALLTLPKAAAFLDAENQPDADIACLLTHCPWLDIVERHAYADWRNPGLTARADALKRAGFRIHQTWSGRRPGAHKNTADGYMARGIGETLCRRPDIPVVMMVSGDAYFVPLAGQLHQQGITVIVAADPLRASRPLLRAADQYLPLGHLAQQIIMLDRLERANRYLTFSFVPQRAPIRATELERMIHKGLVIQEEVYRPGRGTRPEVRLNRQSYVVRTVLSAVAQVSPGALMLDGRLYDERGCLRYAGLTAWPAGTPSTLPVCD